jgi:zinc protease
VAALAGSLTLGSAGHGAQAAVRPPRLQYQVRTLANGLTVILSEDHSAPIVHVQLWYHVGSRDERPGRTGFAHLFEHMMFKGSTNVAPEAHTSLLARIGGQSNAYTTTDVTVFWETARAQYLPLMLWLEADRMATLRVDGDTFAREREVVKEERRMRIENQPYGRLAEIIFDRAFTVHPYKHQPIGAMADLEAASIDDVRDFYRTYYRPDNATLTIVGDFEPAQAAALVDQYFSRIPRPAVPVPRDIPAEPAMTRERRVTIQEGWPLPVVVVAHHMPRDGDADSYPLQVASKVLSDGQSSRIVRTLVHDSGIALTAFGTGSIVEDPGLFFAVAVVQPGHAIVQAEEALIGEINRLATAPVSPHELQRAKAQFARDYIMGRETNEQKAAQLAHAGVIHHDVRTADGEFETIMNVTASDVQRVARTYFTPTNRLVLTVMPRAQTQ